MTVRELVAAARRAGFEHIVYGGSFGSSHVWRTDEWAVEIQDRDDGEAVLCVSRRPRSLGQSWTREIAKVTVSSVDQVAGVLAALGVLHVEQVPA